MFNWNKYIDEKREREREGFEKKKCYYLFKYIEMISKNYWGRKKRRKLNWFNWFIFINFLQQQTKKLDDFMLKKWVEK